MCLRKEGGGTRDSNKKNTWDWKKSVRICVHVCACVIGRNHTITQYLDLIESAQLSPAGLPSTTRWCSGLRLDTLHHMNTYSVCAYVCVHPGEAVKTSVPVVPAYLCWSESRQVSWSRFTCSHLQLASIEMTEKEAITGASNRKQMCNYENRGLHLARSLPQRCRCNPQCNPQQPNPQTAN